MGKILLEACPARRTERRRHTALQGQSAKPETGLEPVTPVYKRLAGSVVELWAPAEYWTTCAG